RPGGDRLRQCSTPADDCQAWRAGGPVPVSVWTAGAIRRCPATLRPAPEAAMLPYLLLATVLASGQTPPAPIEVTAPLLPRPPVPPAPETPPPPAASVERWLLMKELQGTWPGWLLDSQRTQVYGWVQQGFAENP